MEVLAQFDAFYIEHNCLSVVLRVLRTLTSSKVFQFISKSQRLKIQNSVCFNVLSLASLKQSQSLSQSSTMVQIVEIASNLILNCNSQDLTIQTDMVHALVCFSNKVGVYEFNNGIDGEALKNKLQTVLSVQLAQVIAPKRQEKF
jgi:hypothetical protein